MYFQQNDDAALVRRCLDGDAAAFETLVRRYQHVVYTIALRMLGDYEDARDATQNAFIKLYEKLDRYDPAYRFFSWMYRIAVNECLNTRRARQPDRCEVGESSGLVSPADAVETAERHRDLRDALLALPAASREVIVLRHFAGLSYQELSAAIGVPVKTVKSRLHAARHQLADRLSAWSVR